MEELIIAVASLVCGGGGVFAFQRFRRPRKPVHVPSKNPGSDEYQRWKGH